MEYSSTKYFFDALINWDVAVISIKYIVTETHFGTPKWNFIDPYVILITLLNVYPSASEIQREFLEGSTELNATLATAAGTKSTCQSPDSR